MNIMNAIKNQTNYTYTENNELAYRSSLDSVLDLFYFGGSMIKEHDKFVDLFQKAFAEAPELAIKVLFYIRDIRGGQGVRENFRCVIKNLAKVYPDIAKQLIEYIPEYGRYDDLYTFVGTSLEADVFGYMKKVLEQDLDNMNQGKSVTLLAKWLKSENTSSKDSVKLAKKTRKHFNMTSKEYRQTLSKLRKYIDVTEVKISANEWDKVEYQKVPSRAMKLYRNAFRRHDEQRFNQYVKDVLDGKQKMNAATLYPHEIISKMISGFSGLREDITAEENQLLTALWNNLPKYETKNALVVVDVSGSMFVPVYSNIKAVDVSVSLGMYVAENNTGIYKDKFITFSESPQLQTINGKDLYSRVNSLVEADWGFNTDLMQVFDVVLRAAKEHNIAQEEMPEMIMIISDMQFDEAVSGQTSFETIKRKFKRAGYNLPKLVYWNVAANFKGNLPVTKDEYGTFLISGFNPVIVKYLMQNKIPTPLDLMYDIINAPRYQAIKIKL